MPCFYRAPTDNDRGGSGGNSHANRCGFGSEKRSSNFWEPGSSVCASGQQSTVASNKNGPLSSSSHPHQSQKHLRIVRNPPKSIRWKEAGLDRMAVVPETVKLESKTVSERCVEVRFRAKNVHFGPLFADDRRFESFPLRFPLFSFLSSMTKRKRHLWSARSAQKHLWSARCSDQ